MNILGALFFSLIIHKKSYLFDSFHCIFNLMYAALKWHMSITDDNQYFTIVHTEFAYCCLTELTALNVNQ